MLEQHTYLTFSRNFSKFCHKTKNLARMTDQFFWCMPLKQGCGSGCGINIRSDPDTVSKIWSEPDLNKGWTRSLNKSFL